MFRFNYLNILMNPIYSFLLISLFFSTICANAQNDTSRHSFGNSELTYKKGKIYLGDSLISGKDYDLFLDKYRSSRGWYDNSAESVKLGLVFMSYGVVGGVYGLNQTVFHNGANAGQYFACLISVPIGYGFILLSDLELKKAVKLYNAEISGTRIYKVKANKPIFFHIFHTCYNS
jgi:hypothetical protein